MTATPKVRDARGRSSPEWLPPAFAYALWYAFVFSLPFTDLVFLPRVFRDSLQMSTLLLIALVVSLVSWAWSTKARFSRPDLTSGLLYLFLVVAALSVLQSVWSPLQEYRGERLWDKGIRQVLALSICVATYAVTIAMVRSRAQVIKSLMVYVGSLGPALLAGLIDLLNFYSPSPTVSFFAHMIHRNVLIAPGQIQDVIVPRVQLLAFEPSMAANYLLSVVPIAFALLAATRRQSLRLLTVAAGLIGGLLFVGTFSLGGILAAWIGLIAFVAFAHFVLPWRRVIQIAIVAGAALAVMLLIPIQTSPSLPPASQTTPAPETSASQTTPTPGPSISTEPSSAPENRLVAALSQAGTSNVDVSSSWRLITLVTAWNTFRDHPLAGVGWGNSNFYVLQDFPPFGWRHPYALAWTTPDGEPASTTSANNLVARVLAETGLMGALIFIAWHVGVARRAILALKAGDPLMLGLLVASAGIVAHYAALSGLSLRYWFFLPAMIVAMSAILRADPGKEKVSSVDAQATMVAVRSGRTNSATRQ